jgi:hypothetical protein
MVCIADNHFLVPRPFTDHPIGFLLTMAPMPGLDFLDADLDQHLDAPKEAFFDNEHASVIGLMFELFSKTGTATWVSIRTPYRRVYTMRFS